MAKNIAMVIANNFEDVEATSPKEYLESKGAKVTVIGIDNKVVTGKKGATLTPDTTFAERRSAAFVSIFIAGSRGTPRFSSLALPRSANRQPDQRRILGTSAGISI